MNPEAWVSVIIQLGVGGVMLFMFQQVVSGKLRTLQEMEARRETTEAERNRTKRAEEQTDKLLPAMQQLTEAVHTMIQTQARVLDRLEDSETLAAALDEKTGCNRATSTEGTARKMSKILRRLMRRQSNEREPESPPHQDDEAVRRAEREARVEQTLSKIEDLTTEIRKQTARAQRGRPQWET